MKNLWDQKTASRLEKNPLQLRVFSSQLLGLDSDLVLHGGGNTSVKLRETNIFGEEEDILYVKGSGRNLARENQVRDCTWWQAEERCPDSGTCL